MQQRKFARSAAALLMSCAIESIAFADVPSPKCVKTDSDIPLKVILRTDTAVFASADATSSSTHPGRTFDTFYVLDPTGNAPRTRPTTGPSGQAPRPYLKNDFYMVANTADGVPIGWVPADKVVEWSHKQVLLFKPQTGRKPADFYETKETLNSAYNGGAAQVFASEPAKDQSGRVLPVLDEFPMTTANGDEVNGYEIAYLTNSSAAKTAKPLIDLGKSTADFVFVIDTTQSMGPEIEATKEVISGLAKNLNALNVSKEAANRIRFGLVLYRDKLLPANTPKDWYITKLACKLEDGKDLTHFLEALNQATVAASGSEDTPEDVLAGLDEAINKMDWNPNGNRNIILIGDASAQTSLETTGEYGYKNERKKTIETIVAASDPIGEQAVRSRITINAFGVLGEDPSDYDKRRADFNKLSQGRDGKNPGLSGEFSGKANEQGPFIREISEKLVKTIGYNFNKSADPSKPTDDDVRNVMGLAAILEQRKAGTVDPNASGPQFGRGYVCSIGSDIKVTMEPALLVRKKDFNTYLQTCKFFVNGMKKMKGQDLGTIVDNLKTAAGLVNMPGSFDQNTSMIQIINAAMQLPVESPIFKYTAAQLAPMQPEEFANWKQTLEQHMIQCQDLLDNPKLWFSLGGTDVPDDDKHAYIALKDLN